MVVDRNILQRNKEELTKELGSVTEQLNSLVNVYWRGVQP